MPHQFNDLNTISNHKKVWYLWNMHIICIIYISQHKKTIKLQLILNTKIISYY